MSDDRSVRESVTGAAEAVDRAVDLSHRLTRLLADARAASASRNGGLWAGEAQPAPTDPAPTDPAPTGLVPTGPAATGLAPAGPASNGPVPAEPAPSGPGSTGLAPAEVHGPQVALPHSSGMAAGATEGQRAHVDDLVRRFNERTRTSKEVAQRYRQVLADSRAVVGFRSATKEMHYPIAGRGSNGSRLEDVDGNSYVDITMGFGALLFGHEPAFVKEAVREHLERGVTLGPRSVDTGEAARLLGELTGMERVAFANSGTEANSAAIRLARAATGRDKVVMFRGSYHGHIDSVLGRAAGRDHVTVPVSRGIPDSAVAELVVLEYGEPESLRVIDELGDRIAAVMVEPVQCRKPSLRPLEFMTELRELTRRRGIVLLFDEMLTGLRPHPRGAQHLYGVTPDLATYGKALGGGFPIGAIAGRADIMNGVDGGFWRYGDDSRPPHDTTFFGGTYMQHPVSMAAARAVLTHLTEHSPVLQNDLNARTERLAGTLNRFFVEEDFPLRLDHFGSMFRFTHRADLELLYHHLLLRGVYVWEWRSFYLSTAHTDADLEFVADAVKGSLRELRDAGFFRTPKPKPRPQPQPQPQPQPKKKAPDFSVYFFGDYPQDKNDDTDKYALISETARFADEHGFHALWLPERHFHSFGGLFPNPSVLASALARETGRIRLNAGSVVLPLHDPIRVAEEWSMVDNLSGGRVGLGLANGWHSSDFVFFPDRFEGRKETTFEHLDDVRRLWRGEALRRTGGAGDEVEVRLYPRPVQEAPPMYLATAGRRESYEHAARHDLGIVTNLMGQTIEQLGEHVAAYRRARAEHGLDPDAGRVTVLLHTYLGADHDAARAEALEPMGRYMRSSLFMRSAASLFGNGAGDPASMRPEDLDYLFRRAYDRYCDQRALIGTPETCASVVDALREAGVDEIAALVDFGMPADRLRSGLRHLDALRRRYQEADREADATAAQRRLWTACQVTGVKAYNEVASVRLHGPLDEAALRAALRTVVDRHDGLRTVFRPGSDGLPRQVVRARVDVPLVVTDRTGQDAGEAIREAQREASEHPYDLAEGPLLRPVLLRFGDDDHVLVLGVHHIVTDAHSTGLIARDLETAYRAARDERTARFDRPAGTALDLAGAEPAADPADLAWWRGHLGEAPPVLRLPTDRPRTRTSRGRGGSVGLRLGAETTAALQAWSAEQRVTVFATLLTAWQVVLRRFSGQDEFVVGSTFDQRVPEARDTVGFFVALLPLRLALSDDLDLREAARATRNVLLDASEHSAVSFDDLMAAVNPDPGTARPLMPVTADLDAETLPGLDLPGVTAEPVEGGSDAGALELALMATRSGSGLRLRIRYDADLYDEATVRRYLAHLELVLEAIASGAAGRVGDLPLLTGEDEKDLVRLANGEAAAPYPRTLDGVRPADDEGTAVVLGDTEWSRRRLRRAADAVTARLIELGVGTGDIVAVALPKGPEYVAAVLGVVGARAAYVPLDLGQPEPRLAAMLADAAPAAVICGDPPHLALDDAILTVHVDGQETDLEPRPPSAPDDPLCLIYTSGSTGTPKGVVTEHGNLAATLALYRDALDITEDDRLSLYTSVGFDASHIELWPAVATGAELHVVPEEIRLDPEALVRWIVERRITVAFLPTSMGEAVLELPWPEETALRVLSVGGEQLNVRPRPGLPFTFVNVYGPTETTVFCSWGPVAPDEPGVPTIGTPTPDMRLEIRDARDRPLPPGAPGELHVGGPQVARGYHNAPERFRVDEEGRRWYPTGDVVRWRSDGRLHFVGRADDQVQIRGVRVEPAEVTRAVRGLSGVRDARVAGEPDAATGRTRLRCHVVPDAPVTDEADRVRRWRAELATVLPRPMVPEVWSVLADLPMTAVGKWDRTAPEPDPGPLAAVRAEWSAALGGAEVPDDAVFFDLGGHSISAIRLLNRIREVFGVEYPMSAFFEDPTVRGMAARLSDTDRVRGEL